MSLELLDIMNNIVNVRKYNGKEIPENILTDLYKAFCMGPSSISNQARELLVVKGKVKHQKIVQATLNPYMTEDSFGAQSWLLDAPFVGVVIIERRRAVARVGDIGISIAEQEAEGAIQNFRLLAYSHGLSTACVREMDQETLQNNLDIPWYTKPVAIVSAGYSDHKENIPPRLSICEMVSEEEWK